MPKYREYTKKELKMMYDFIEEFAEDDNKMRMMFRLKQIISYERTLMDNYYKNKKQ